MLPGLDMARGDFLALFADKDAIADSQDVRGYARRRFQRLVVPFAIPLMIGPGAISAVIIQAGEAAKLGYAGTMGSLVAIAAACAVSFVCFAMTGSLSRLLGEVGMAIIVRVLGLILCALAIQFILLGLGEAIPGMISGAVTTPTRPPNKASVGVLLDGVDIVVGQAEMVADLVDQDVGDQFGQADVAALAPFVQDRTAIQEDPRRLRRRSQAVASADVHAMIQAGQFERILDLQIRQRLFVGEIVDAEHHLARRRPELGRQGVERLARQSGEIVEGGGEEIGGRFGHASAIAVWGPPCNGAR